MSDMRRALVEGLCDAGGFFFGALLGWWLGRSFGFDVLAPGWGGPQTIGLLLILVGCALGRWAALRAKAHLLGGDEP